MKRRVAVLGAGSWGTALAIVLSRAGNEVSLWGRDPRLVEQMRSLGHNPRYLPRCPLPPGLRLEGALDTAVSGADLVVMAGPSRGFRDLARQLAGCCGGGARVVWATKGFEPGSGRLLHEVAAEALPPRTALAVLSGPTFAAEVAADLPAAVTVASADAAFAVEVAETFHNPRFRAYTSDDVIGVEAGGAVKNVLAIAAGIADGLGFGANTRAALITRGLAEMTRLGVALGGRQVTFMGLAGLGDLVLTCTDDQSRNRRFGLGLALGRTVEDAQREIGQVVEGVNSARQASRVARQAGVDMPITEQVARIIAGETTPEEAVNTLLTRAPRPERG